MTLKLRPLPECGLVSCVKRSTLVGHQGAVTVAVSSAKSLTAVISIIIVICNVTVELHRRSEQMSPQSTMFEKSPPASPGSTVCNT
jgi:hypothetical protein